MGSSTHATICHVLLAMTDERTRIVAASMLAEHGWAVSEVEHAHNLLFAVHQHDPQVVVLDLDVPVSDLLSTVRILRRNPKTTHAQILVAAPKHADRALLVELANTGAAGVLVKPLAGKLLIAKIGECLQQHRAKATALPQEKAEHGAQHVPGNTSLLRRRLGCPFHEKPVELWHYALRSGKVGVEMSFFDVPAYTEAAPGAVYVDYHLLAVAVCPDCFFATNNPDYFALPENRRPGSFTFDAATRRTMPDLAGDRLKQRHGISPHFFDEHRSLPDALLAYDAAIATSRQLHGCNPHAFAVELVRIGNYHLRLAHLSTKYELGAAKMIGHYEQAATALKEAYIYVQGPLFYRNAYQIIAVLMYLNRDGEAYQYVGRLKELDQAGALEPADRQALTRYLAASQKAWEDREYHRQPT
jgi:DNA-binding response OmpR family regulator